ncbi:hypothetical protein GCM10010275_30160 [Streptomyces litmocidini]|uniref:hypothetical protein n=1 Tax=Streptomyces litmocidini TaxID=67318 RepID=UPI00167F161E|nr:hypothetical protein [Streptomyces litmocidini]GGU91080.1 hypothetical protein GCM10010275_30160 [Streptomyces litmocidini]
MSTRQSRTKHPKEQATDTLPTVYRATPRDFTALVQHLQVGDALYTQTDTDTRRWIVTEHRSVTSKAPMVAPADTDGQAPLIPLQQLLVRYGAIHIQPPDQT